MNGNHAEYNFIVTRHHKVHSSSPEDRFTTAVMNGRQKSVSESCDEQRQQNGNDRRPDGNVRPRRTHLHKYIIDLDQFSE